MKRKNITKNKKEGGEKIKILFQLTDEDAQELALEKLGRELTDDELYNVKKGVEWGLDCWGKVMIDAIEEATNKDNEIK